MTCIAAVVHENEVWIGGDSAGVAGYSMTIRADTKVFRRQRRQDEVAWVFGFTTSFRMGQLIKYRLDLPELPETTDTLEQFMVTTFIDVVRTTLRDGGWLYKNSEREQGGNFLVGVAGQLFEVDSDFQVGQLVHPYGAVGCGQDLALGSLYSTPQLPPATRLQLALGAAAEFSAGVRPPFVVVRERDGGA